MGAAVLSLAACGKSDTAQTTAAQAAESADSTAVDTEDKKEIVYGKSQGPYTELFEAAIVPILEKEGYTVKGVDFSDLQTADIGLNDGDVDVNVEQHTAYAENFNANYNADLVPISPIPTVPAGVYSAKYTSVDEIADGAKVAVPNDASNTARRCLMVFETSDQSFLELRKPLEQIFPGISNSNDRYGQQQGNENRQNNGNWQNGNRQWQGNENRQNENRQWQNNGNWQQQNNGSWQNTQRYRSNFNWNALKTQKLPWCNIIIIVLNVLVFLYTDLFAYSQNDAIVNAGALSWYAVLEQGQWYRLLTCMFLHSNLEHIFNNMLILGYVGSCLEEKIGSIRYGILYLASGILAGCASMGYNMLQNDNVVSIGASGAIFGVIGAMLFVVLARRNEEDRYTVRQIAVMAALSLYGGLTSQGVDNAAHFGGFIAGFILAWILTMLQKRRGVS